MNTSSIEFTDKAVSAPGCAYANLVGYAGSNLPGQKYSSALVGEKLPENVKGAVDSNGQPLIDSDGKQVLVDSNGKLIFRPVTNSSVCGQFNTMKNAYGGNYIQTGIQKPQ